MRRFRFVGVGVALLAVVGLSAMAVASSASAAVTFLLASWLVSGGAVAATTLTEASGELLLENEKSIAGKVALQKCSNILFGDVGPNSADDITEVLTLGGVAVSSTALIGTAVTCELEAICENSSKVWAVNLPWLTELELWEEGTESGFVDLLTPHTGGGNVGWYVECKSILTVSEECTTPLAVASQTNEATGVLATFSEPFTVLMGAKLALCSGNNEESGVVEGGGLTTIPGGGVLSVSAEAIQVWNAKTRYLKGAKVEWKAGSGTCYEAEAITEGEEPPADPPWEKVAC